MYRKQSSLVTEANAIVSSSDELSVDVYTISLLFREYLTLLNTSSKGLLYETI